MAIDTADKRASAFGWPGTVFPTPDGSLALAADRLHVAGLYRGIATAVITPISITGRLRAVEAYQSHAREAYRAQAVEAYRSHAKDLT